MKHLIKRPQILWARLFRLPRKRKRTYSVNYHEQWLAPPLAVFIGIYIVLYSHRRSFGEAIFMPAFYKAALPSVAAAWLMMHHVVQRTYRLDNAYPWAVRWWRGPWYRLLLQLWHGVVVPGFFVLIFYAFYFTVRGHALRFWKYLREDFHFVLLMLLGFNVLLWTYYRLRTREMRAEYRHWKSTYGKNDDEMEDKWGSGGADLTVADYAERVKDRIAYYQPSGRGNNINHAVDFDGQVDLVMQSLRDCYALVEGYHFFRVRDNLILNRKAIRSIRIADKVVTIVLDEPRLGEEVNVSHRRTKEFLEWYRGRGALG